jgi:hypothetical protein
VRQALKEVELDSSRRVELEDYVDVRMRILDPAAYVARMLTVILGSSSQNSGSLRLEKGA